MSGVQLHRVWSARSSWQSIDGEERPTTSALREKKSILGGNEMAISTIDQSQRKAARVAGFTYVFTNAAGVFELTRSGTILSY